MKNNMRFFLLAIITLLPTYLVRFHVGQFPTTLLEILLLATFVYWITQKIKTKTYNLAPSTYNLPILLFLLSGVIAIFVAPDTRSALGLFRAYIVEPILFFIMFIDVARKWSPRANLASGGPTVWRDVTIALSLSALGVALPAIYQEWNPIGIPNIHWAAEATRRVTSWYGFPNAIGLYLAPLIPFFVAQIFQKGERLVVKCYLSIVTIAAVAAIVFAHSEGALFALVFVGIIAGLAYKKTRLWTATLALLFALAILYNPGWYSYAHDQLTLQNDSGKVRRIQWEETAHMLRDHPFFGAGLAGYPKTFAPYHKATYIEIYQYPHNILLNFWSELGLTGVVAFFWLIAVFFKKSIKNLSPTTYHLQPILMASMSIILIHGLVDVVYFKNDLAIFFWLLLALTFTNETPMVMDKEKK